jgi:hypothetical protein
MADGNFWVDEIDVNDYVVWMSQVTKLGDSHNSSTSDNAVPTKVYSLVLQS